MFVQIASKKDVSFRNFGRVSQVVSIGLFNELCYFYEKPNGAFVK